VTGGRAKGGGTFTKETEEPNLPPKEKNLHIRRAVELGKGSEKHPLKKRSLPGFAGTTFPSRRVTKSGTWGSSPLQENLFLAPGGVGGTDPTP